MWWEGHKRLPFPNVRGYLGSKLDTYSYRRHFLFNRCLYPLWNQNSCFYCQFFLLTHIIWIQKNNTFYEKKVNTTEWQGIFLLKEVPKRGRPSPLDILIHGLQLLLTAYIFAKYQRDQPLHYLFVLLRPTFIAKNIFLTNERRVDSRIRNNIPRQKLCDLLSVLWFTQKTKYAQNDLWNESIIPEFIPEEIVTQSAFSSLKNTST